VGDVDQATQDRTPTLADPLALDMQTRVEAGRVADADHAAVPDGDRQPWWTGDRCAECPFVVVLDDAGRWRHLPAGSTADEVRGAFADRDAMRAEQNRQAGIDVGGCDPYTDG
jgi:hypothetical protein